MKNDYADLVAHQINQYKDDDNKFNDLPEAFHVWSNLYLSKCTRQVFSFDNFPEICADQFLTSVKNFNGIATFLSIGCGDGSVEIEVAGYLRTRGLSNFDFICLDLSPILIDRFRAKIPAELLPHFTLRVSDINKQAIPSSINAVMAHHSLHHMIDLEEIFAGIYSNLCQNGVFVTSDMIGRNGHMRWAEAKLFVDFFWPFLTASQRKNIPLDRLEKTFLDHDCSSEAFEGIRAQDILEAILQSGFYSKAFVGYGGFVDVFIDRGFGHNFSVTAPDDIFLIKRISFLNELLLDAGLIKPTMMIACFVKQAVEERCFRRRTAAASVRPTASDPEWLQDALADFDAVTSDPDFVYGSMADVKEQGLSYRAIADLQFALQQMEKSLEKRDTEIAWLYASTSWRLTAPLRALRRLMGGG